MFYKNKITQLLLSLLIILGTSFFIGIYSNGYSLDLKKLSYVNKDFSSYSHYFQKLSIDKGASHAYDILKIAKLPPNIDFHLLGHVVGDELYKQEGIEGIKICTNDFRNACSHSIVIGVLLERGDSALSDIADACHLAPGGKGAYTMCFHGLGHGVLAYVQYELPEAIKFCKLVGTNEYRNREYIECVGGAVMELISGGGHDKETWQKITPKYFRENDPLYPCTANFMPELVKPNCFTYLTPHLLMSVGGDLGNPTVKNFEEAFRLCDAIPIENKINRERCFGGFGKEFVSLAQERDIRKIESMNKEQLSKVGEWCDLANDDLGTLQCDIDAVQSLFWGGENKPNASIIFCSILSNPERQKNCFDELTGAVSYYISDNDYKYELCKKYPDEYKNICKSKLLLN